MAGLHRFITYINKYKNREKLENSGFAKIEIRGNICRVEVHIHNENANQPETTVYLFTEQANIMHGIPVGTIEMIKGHGDVRYAFDLSEISKFGLSMADLEGIYIPFEADCFLASRWKEGELTGKTFQVLDKKNTEEKPEAVPPPEEKEPLIAPPPEEEAPKQTAEIPKDTGHSDENNVQTAELPLEIFLDDKSWEGIFQKLRLKLNIFFPFEGSEIECVRMQLNHLQELPKKYWYIANNSFLLHGFFNYRHIIFGEIKENNRKAYLIGVPGVFQNQERVMASMFGFPEFRTARNTEYKTGNFGYWYRII